MKIIKYIKVLFFLCLILVVEKTCYAQLNVDAGKDTTYCVGLYADTLLLGRDVVIVNGDEPYAISWECKVPKGLYSFYTASDLLSDTTVTKPNFLYAPTHIEWIKFTLHVTDSENNYAKDSLYVRFSKFGYLTGYHVIEIEKGDSILFKDANIGGGIEPLSFFWQPKTGLSNPDSLVTWCKPDSSTNYSIVAIDSCGCISDPNLMYEIKVLTTGLDELTVGNLNALNIRKEGIKIYFNNPLKKEAHITLFSLNGTARYDNDITDDHFEVFGLLKTKGIYIVKISVNGYTESKKIQNY